MADDVNVNFGAQVAGLLGGLQQSTQGIQTFVAQSQAQLGALTSTFQKLQSAILAVATGYVFKEIVQGAIETTTEVVKLGKAFGINLEQASYLRVELASLNISSEDYRDAAMRLDRQVRTNEAGLRQFGMTTRDANNNLLDQKALLQSAVQWTLQYKEGTDRTIAAQTAFGRGAGDTVLKLAKMTDATRDAAIETARSLGLITTDEDAARAREYKAAMAQVALTLEGIRDAIGNAVLPYLTKFSVWFREQGPSIIANMKTIVADAVQIAFDIAIAMVNTLSSIMNGVYNVFVVYQYIKQRLGFTTEDEANKSIDGFDRILTKIEEVRTKAVSMLQSLKASAAAGEQPTVAPVPEPQKGGNKSASNLIIDKDGSKAAQKAIDGEIAVIKQGFEQKKMLLDADYARHVITEDQKIQLVQQATEDEYQAELKLLQRKLQISGMERSAKQEVLNQISLLEAKHRTDTLRLDIELAASRQKLVEGTVSTVESSWNGSLRAMLAGTQTFGQTMKNIVADLVVYWIEQLGKKLIFEKATAALTTALFGAQKTAEVGVTVAAETAKTGAVVTGEAARTGATEVGALARVGTVIAEALTSIGAALAAAFAGIVAALSFLGPLAVPAAVGVVAGAGAIAYSMMPKFEKGAYRIPRTMPAVLHPGERVLNAEEAAQSRGEKAGGEGGSTYHLNFIDAAGAQSFINRNIDRIAPAVAGYQKRNRSSRLSV